VTEKRSVIFYSQSKVVHENYGPNKVMFFYIKVGDEIARVEVPQWIALDESRLNMVHSIVLDQCRRGHGYPIALSEAHEQAVINTDEREYFWQLVESSLYDNHLPVANSAKSISKRMRWV